MTLSSRTTVLEGDVILVLIKYIDRDSVCSAALLTSNTMLKPFSDDAPQKMHRAIGSRASTSVDPQHNMAKAKEETDRGWHALSATRGHQQGIRKTCHVTCRTLPRSIVKVPVAITIISKHTATGGAEPRLVHPCRMFRTRTRGVSGARISSKPWKAQRRSRYLGSSRLRQLGTSSGPMMRSIRVNGGRYVVMHSQAHKKRC